MNTISVIFIAATLIGIYLAFISPRLNIVSNIKSNRALSKYVSIIQGCEAYDERSCKKFKIKLSYFLDAYSHTFDYPAASDRYIRKMISAKRETIKYLNRIPFRLPNNPIFIEEVSNANKNIELIIENYIVDAAKRNKFYYFPTQNS